MLSDLHKRRMHSWSSLPDNPSACKPGASFFDENVSFAIGRLEEFYQAGSAHAGGQF
jgi:hypothetical protein